MIELLNNLPSPLVSILGFFITILFLVTIHEFGHFWVARRFGVKIEKFSIGFGKPIVKWQGKKDNTEYSISWIPLGGYVKMYGEGSEAYPSEQATIDDNSDFTSVNNIGSFSALPPFKRFLIAFAGPAVNLLFTIFAFWLLFIIGTAGTNPYIGQIQAQSSFASAGLQSGDKITAINDKNIYTIADAIISLVNGLGNQKNSVIVERDSRSQTLSLDLAGYPSGSELDINKAIGFSWEIAEVINNQPAILATVSEGSPAQNAGLEVGDKVISINNQMINSWADMTAVIRHNPNQAIPISVMRDGEQLNLSITPEAHPKDRAIGFAGVSGGLEEGALDKYHTLQKYNALEAIPKAVGETVFQAKFLLKMLGKLITGEASIKNMGGPLTIADISGKTIKHGYESFFRFLASISLTLAIINLLPIPALDGGHMVICIAEMIKGKPLSDKAIGILMRVGVSILITFMAVVISLDIWKYLGKLF